MKYFISIALLVAPTFLAYAGSTYEQLAIPLAPVALEPAPVALVPPIQSLSTIDKDKEIRRLRNVIIDINVEKDLFEKKLQITRTTIADLREKLGQNIASACKEEITSIGREKDKKIESERKRGIRIGMYLERARTIDRFIRQMEEHPEKNKKEINSVKTYRSILERNLQALGYSLDKKKSE